MTEQFKKIEREYVLSDSTVNEYGFRLLTSGYQLADFQKNPIGYYMHRREEGVVLKWEDLRLEGDRVVGTPVINLSNGRGEQTCAEAENGFLNAASVGHIVVLAYSMDPTDMLPGQTGPTITKWYNKECSLVDIPGNCNALTRLYDEQEQELNLADMRPVSGAGGRWQLQEQKAVAGSALRQAPSLSAGGQDDKTDAFAEATAGKPSFAEAMAGETGGKELRAALELADGASDADVLVAVETLAGRVRMAEQEKDALADEAGTLRQQMAELQAAMARQKVDALLDTAQKDGKITPRIRVQLVADYAENPIGLKSLLDVMPVVRQAHYDSSVGQASRNNRNGHDDNGIEAEWEWDDYEQNDPSGTKLRALRAEQPGKYTAIFAKKFRKQAA